MPRPGRSRGKADAEAGTGAGTGDGRRSLFEPHPDRLAPTHPARTAILAAHRAAVEAGDPGYVDPGTGLFVFTSAHLAATGRCCQSGCRHCPWV